MAASAAPCCLRPRGRRAWIGTGENLRMVSAGPRSERGGTIAWTREPSGSRASAQGDDSSTRRPNGPTMRSIRCRTDSSPSNSPSGALSMRPPRSTYTSSDPLTMTSVTSGSLSRNSIGPNPTTSSETSLTMRVSSRCGRIGAAGAQELERLLANPNAPLGAGCGGEPASVHPRAQLIAQLSADERERLAAHDASSYIDAGLRTPRQPSGRTPGRSGHAPAGSFHGPGHAPRRGRTAGRPAAGHRTPASRHLG